MGDENPADAGGTDQGTPDAGTPGGGQDSPANPQQQPNPPGDMVSRDELKKVIGDRDKVKTELREAKAELEAAQAIRETLDALTGGLAEFGVSAGDPAAMLAALKETLRDVLLAARVSVVASGAGAIDTDDVLAAARGLNLLTDVEVDLGTRSVAGEAVTAVIAQVKEKKPHLFREALPPTGDPAPKTDPGRPNPPRREDLQGDGKEQSPREKAIAASAAAIRQGM